MTTIIDGIDQRTNLAGTNRLELLLFRLGNHQRFAINVFKVREALPCPPLTKMPGSHPNVIGVASVRGQTVPIVDLAKSIGRPPIENPAQQFVILTEYNRSIHGFLVTAVDKIINTSWSDVSPPPVASGTSNYLTAITKVDDKLVQIVDVEQVLAEVIGLQAEVSEEVMQRSQESEVDVKRHILVVDDSSVARKQIIRTLSQIGLETTVAKNGREALNLLESWIADDDDIRNQLAMIISDIEMPEMDGYTLTAEIRKKPELANIKILLHSSMSGTFNQALVEKVGADYFIPKYSSDELAEAVQAILMS
jgi:two-component system chemotaxis response regulator CheV